MARLGQAVSNALQQKSERDQRQAVQAALRESEARFRRLAENAQDIIYRYRIFPVAGFEYVSPAVTAITGYTPEDLYASPDLGTQLIYPEDQQMLLSIIEEGVNRPVAMHWKRKDGKLIWIEMRYTLITNEVGKLVAFMFVSTTTPMLSCGIKETSAETPSMLPPSCTSLCPRYVVMKNPSPYCACPTSGNVMGVGITICGACMSITSASDTTCLSPNWPLARCMMM